MPELRFGEPSTTSVANTSLRIIAAGIVVAGLYYASSVVVTLVLAIFIAFVLDPGVKGMERLNFPRWLGSLILVLLGVAAVYLLIYTAYDRALALLATLPRLGERLHEIIDRLETFFSFFSSGGGSPGPSPISVPMVRIQGQVPWATLLWRGIGSAYAVTVTVMFIPFLVFFMLTSKNHIWAASLNLFPAERRQQAEDVIQGIGDMVRQYVLGNFLVAAISAAIITPIFIALRLPYAVILGVVSACLNLIPYVGVLLAMLPPLLVGLLAFESLGPFITVAVSVAVVHFLAVNLLTPKLVGHRVKLNALAVTLGMMFWGWLWGAIGLVLAIPITAAFKAVCDNIRSLKPLGTWMGES